MLRNWALDGCLTTLHNDWERGWLLYYGTKTL
jgi:hypothetical protein